MDRCNDLKGRNLRRVRFARADHYSNNLQRADLRDADLSRASLDQARFAGTDLRGAIIEGGDLKTLDRRCVRIDVAQAVVLTRSRGVLVELE